ncbi:MAG: hypothetical protein MZW92_76895 [Comamonadaceae bacterium]|nr:hypothetical protein [Comamonadaceae bacterium]
MNHPDLARFAWISIAAAVATIVLKGLAWWLTGSVGLLSDAMESFVNLAGASDDAGDADGGGQAGRRRPQPSATPRPNTSPAVCEGMLILLAAIGHRRHRGGAADRAAGAGAGGHRPGGFGSGVGRQLRRGAPAAAGRQAPPFDRAGGGRPSPDDRTSGPRQALSSASALSPRPAGSGSIR